MLNAGLVSIIFVDRHKARFWKQTARASARHKSSPSRIKRRSQAALDALRVRC
jgi:hypothetical protein